MGIVDHLINAETAQKIGVMRRCGTDNPRTPPLRELDGDMADATRCRMDQYCLISFQARCLEERLPGGERDQRRRRRLGKRE